MDGWALWCETTVDHLVNALHTLLPRHGYQVVLRDPKHVLELFTHPGGTLILAAAALPNRGLADTIHARVGGNARYLELRLEDASVSGTRTELASGATEDIDTEALELLHDWNEGETRKFRSEAYQPLVEALLALDSKDRPNRAIGYTTTVSPRVDALLRAIRAGATWERTTLGDRPAIRVKGPQGAQISVLTDDEEAAFRRGVKR